MGAQTGRPAKGDRVVTYTRLNRRVRVAAEEAAAREGYDGLSDYVAAVISEHLELPDLAPRPRNANTTELPLTG